MRASEGTGKRHQKKRQAMDNLCAAKSTLGLSMAWDDL